MAKKVIGLLYRGDIKQDREFKLFKQLAKKKNLELIMLNIDDKINEGFLKKARQCHLIYNDTAEDFAIEIVKTLESLGKKVIEPSKVYYNLEDKWLFYLLCKEYKIPTLRTILLSEYLPTAKKELYDFNEWPVVIKRVIGTTGEYVGKANTIKQAEKIIKHFWKKGSEKLPMIAQEFVHSPSFRVTLIDGKIAQTAIKRNTHWKSTGLYSKHNKKFTVTPALRKIIKKIIKKMNIKICGIDFMKKNKRWLILEINAEPAFDFIDREQKKMINLVLNCLKKNIKK